jgi:hypothetical protein
MKNLITALMAAAGVATIFWIFTRKKGIAAQPSGGWANIPGIQNITAGINRPATSKEEIPPRPTEPAPKGQEWYLQRSFMMYAPAVQGWKPPPPKWALRPFKPTSAARGYTWVWSSRENKWVTSKIMQAVPAAQ